MANTISRRFTNICVFCGSSSGKNREFEEAADQLGKVLAEKKIHLVFIFEETLEWNFDIFVWFVNSCQIWTPLK
ncbi:hypothetical protein ACOSQ2_004786 [Xanthoceras sorbifolium]